MRWSCFVVKLSTARDRNDVIETERKVMQGWKLHVDWVSTQPADRELRVLLQALALLLDALFPSPVDSSFAHVILNIFPVHN